MTRSTRASESRVDRDATCQPRPAARDTADNLLEIRGLKTHFFTQDGTVKAVDGVSLEIKYGQTLGVVGESGCGKSITALSTMRLIERPGRTVAGEILLDGRDLLKLGDDEMSEVRGNAISMIFQEPMTSLNPVFTCGDQIAEAVALHKKVSAQRGAGTGRSRCSSTSASPTPSGAPRATRTSCRAACGSAS